jgi:hypothetical protein
VQDGLDDASEPNQHHYQATAYDATLHLLHRELQQQQTEKEVLNIEMAQDGNSPSDQALPMMPPCNSCIVHCDSSSSSSSSHVGSGKSSRVSGREHLHASTACVQSTIAAIPNPPPFHLSHQESFMVACKAVCGLDLPSNGQHWADVGKAAALDDRQPACGDSSKGIHAVAQCTPSTHTATASIELSQAKLPPLAWMLGGMHTIHKHRPDPSVAKHDDASLLVTPSVGSMQ